MTQPTDCNGPTEAEVEEVWQEIGAALHDEFGSSWDRQLTHQDIREGLRWDEEQERELQECLAATEHGDRH